MSLNPYACEITVITVERLTVKSGGHAGEGGEVEGRAGASREAKAEQERRDS